MIGAALNLLPQRLVAEGIGFALEALIVGGLAWHYTAQHYETREAAARAVQAEAAASAALAAQTETARRVQAQQEIARDAQQAAQAARADAVRADAAAGSLRVQLSAFLARGGAGPRDPGASAGSQAAGDAVGVLADLLRRADDRAGVLAAAADDAHRAGVACERAYDALSRP